MPWVTKHGTRTFELRQPMPEITLPKPPFPDLAFAESYPRETRARWLWWKRHLAEYLEIYGDCRRAACRRNKACCGPNAECYDESIELLQKYVYPEIRKALRDLPADASAETTEAAESPPSRSLRRKRPVVPAPGSGQRPARG